METLADAYPKEQQRCRELVGEYQALPGGVGAFGAAIISDVLKRAEKAAAEQDTVAMVGLLIEMRECE